MMILKDIRGMFTRRKPVVVDLTTSQASNLTRGADTTVEAKPLAQRDESAGDGDRRTPAVKPRPASSMTAEEVVSMVRQVSNHLEGQARRTDKLIECLERLPGALDALPEINRQNSNLLEMIGSYLDHARKRDQALNDTLGGITTASNRQTEVLGLLQQQIDANTRTGDELNESLGGFREAIQDLAGSSRRTSQVLSDLNQSSESREHHLIELLRRSQRWMIIAAVCCAAVSLLAIGVAAFALFRS